MTKAEKLISSLRITLSSKKDGKPQEDYVAEFNPNYINPLHIRDINYEDGDPYGNAIYISLESAVELAKFLKHLFLDEDTN